VTTIHAHILLEEDDPPQVGTPWLGLDGVNIAVQVGHPSSAYAVLQGTPEDMDRLAETAAPPSRHGPPSRSCVPRPERGA
jgi:hypothetical protein